MKTIPDPTLKYKQICLHLNMSEEFESYKGIHPGKVIERLLKKRDLNQRQFALSLPEHPQTFNAILKGKRSLNTPLSLKIERALNLDEGALMTLQIFYDIKLERLRNQGQLPNLRKILFWDTDMSKIDWHQHDKFIIKRIYERGTKEERDEIDQFYGLERVNEVIHDLPMTTSGNTLLMPHLKR